MFARNACRALLLCVLIACSSCWRDAHVGIARSSHGYTLSKDSCCMPAPQLTADTLDHLPRHSICIQVLLAQGPQLLQVQHSS